MTWYVNDIAGGDMIYGTIDAQGNYRSPMVLPENPNIILTVVPVAAPSFATELEIILFENPIVDTEPPVTTVFPIGGLYNTTQTISLSCPDCVSIFYMLDGNPPSDESQVYLDSIAIEQTTTLKYFGVDLAGNAEAVQTHTYVIDRLAPVTLVQPAAGIYNTSQNVSLLCSDCLGVHYTTDGSEPNLSSQLFSEAIVISQNTIVKYFAVDLVGNREPVKSAEFIIDTQAPTSSALPPGATYINSQQVELSCDSCQDIYYTIDGSNPTILSARYESPITISANTILRFFSVDQAGNIENINTENYEIIVAPEAPNNLLALPGNGQVSLSWDPVGTADSYELYRATTLPVPVVGDALGSNLSSSNFIDSTVVNGTTYYYVVLAVNTSGKSAPSDPQSAQPLPDLPISPTQLTANANDGQVDLSWSHAGGDNISYSIFRAIQAGVSTGGIPYASNINVTSFTDLNVINGTTYYYVVTANNLAGSSTASNEVNATTLSDLTISDVTVNESIGFANITLSLSDVSASTVSIDFITFDDTAGSPDDYDFKTGTIFFDSGEISKNLQIVIKDNSAYEDSESFFINLSNISNATLLDNQSIVTIADDDPIPTISVADVSVDEIAGSVLLTVSLSNPSSQIITVDYETQNNTATEPDDYSFRNGTLQFNPQQQTQSVSIPVFEDEVYEASEQFLLLLSNAINATISDAQANITITEDDPLPSIIISDVSVNEFSGTASLQVILDQMSDLVITVDYSASDITAIASQDYSLTPGTLTFSAGDTFQTITASIIDDGIYEGDKSFSINLGNPGNALIADATGVVTINDNESLGIPFVTALGFNTEIELSWSAVQGASSYDIYRSTSPGVSTSGMPVGNSTSTNYTDVGLINETRYYYRVVAVNGPDRGLDSNEPSAMPGILLGSLVFTDSNLATCVTSQGARLVHELTVLFCSSQNISSIDGIAALTALINIQLENNFIGDVSPLATMSTVNELNLHGNQISNINELSGLSGLTNLALSENQLVDIGALSNLTGLTTLYLYSNNISNLEPLRNLTGLIFLNLQVNAIVNISALELMTALTELRLDVNFIEDLTPLTNLTSLTRLLLYENNIIDVTALQGLAALTYLHLDTNDIVNVDTLDGLINLTALNLHSMPTLSCASVNYLDGVFDSNDGGASGIVTWSDCTTIINAFDFDATEINGWQLLGFADGNDFVYHTPNPVQMFWDDTRQYPVIGPNDPVGNSLGSLLINSDEIVKPGTFPPTATLWFVDAVSPSVTTDLDWQAMTGLDIQLNAPQASGTLWLQFLLNVTRKDNGLETFLREEDVGGNPIFHTLNIDSNWRLLSARYGDLSVYEINNIRLRIFGEQFSGPVTVNVDEIKIYNGL